MLFVLTRRKEKKKLLLLLEEEDEENVFALLHLTRGSAASLYFIPPHFSILFRLYSTYPLCIGFSRTISISAVKANTLFRGLSHIMGDHRQKVLIAKIVRSEVEKVRNETEQLLRTIQIESEERLRKNLHVFQQKESAMQDAFDKAISRAEAYGKRKAEQDLQQE